MQFDIKYLTSLSFFIMLTYDVKYQKSLFVDRYSLYLREWCNRLERENATIFAISRKGPRLIELLVREGLLNKVVLNQVITEHAIPFYEFSQNEKIILIDDSIQHGSTFKRVTELLKKEAELQGCTINILGLPFASSIDVPEINKSIIEATFYPLNRDEVNSFINCQISSFRLLGKPYDIEHPIFSIRGNFNDDIILETALKDFVSRLMCRSKTELILSNLDEQIVVANSEIVTQKKYSIVARSDNSRNLPGAEFTKFRFFLNPERNVLSVVPIRPVAISGSVLKTFVDFLPDEYKDIWTFVISNIQSADKTVSGDLLYESERSQIVFANYLSSYFFLKEYYQELQQTLKDYYADIFFEGFSSFDLQFIIGTSIGKEIANSLQSLLTSSSTLDVCSIADSKANDKIKDAFIPEDFKDDYESFLNERLQFCSTAYEILSYIFYAQHLKIEVPSRSVKEVTDRLRFGVTLKYLFDKVHATLPDADDIFIHSALDTLIDFGTIVPKYINVSNSPDESVWSRVFRVGEGSSIKKIHTLIFLTEELSKKLSSNDIPALLLEKFCVLVLTGDFPSLELKGLEELKISKGFGLYGARAQVKLQNTITNYLDFGETHKVIERNGSKYTLSKNIRDTFKISDLHLTRSERRRITDTAVFCVRLFNTKNLQTKSLVTITTLTCEDDYFLALSAELDLWLHHSTYNVVNCITNLRSIITLDENIDRENEAEKKSKLLDLRKKRLDELNILLGKNAVITKQVSDKTTYYAERKETLLEINKTINDSDDTQIERVWEDFYDIINNHKFNSRKKSSGLNEILSALRLAHRITTILRNLLSVAGYVHSTHEYKASDLKASVQRLVETFELGIKSDVTISNAAVQLFHSNKGKEGLLDQLKAIHNVIDDNTSFRVSMNLLTPVLHEISNNCELLLNEYGSKEDIKPDILYPPQYVILWDVKGSTKFDNRVKELELAFVQTVNERIQTTFGNKVQNFKADMNDGNGFVSDDFAVIAATFEIMYEIAVRQNIVFRAGCDVNYQGELHYYSNTNTIAGRGYEFAARVSNFFKEIDKERWDGELLKEPNYCYLLVSELAQRIADANEQWNFSSKFDAQKLNGLYSPRVKTGTAFPFAIHLVKASDIDG